MMGDEQVNEESFASFVLLHWALVAVSTVIIVYYCGYMCVHVISLGFG
jgi:hypothetical protein